MARKVVNTPAEAMADLDTNPSRPPWLEHQHALPFWSLSPDEFEIFGFLLVDREHPDDKVQYYGKTGDQGRDIVWVRASDGLVTLIQCKRIAGNVGIGEIRAEMAKLFVNVFTGVIPVKP